MNLYKLHSKPETLLNYENNYKVPAIAWDIIKRTKTQEERQKYEQYIKYDGEIAIDYALRYLGRERFIAAEPYIMKSPGSASLYAHHIIKGRWLEAEDIIKQDPRIWKFYKIDFGMNNSGWEDELI